MDSDCENIDSELPSLTSLVNMEATNPELEETCNENEDQICHCCGVKTAKARLHYGGITCYPCRSFFRRATVNKKKKKCKKDGRCQVRLEDRKSCNACRYQECIRNGMRPHLVLSEDQIQERFKNLPTRKKKEKFLNISKNIPALVRDSNPRERSTNHELNIISDPSTSFTNFIGNNSGSTSTFTSRHQIPPAYPQCKTEPGCIVGEENIERPSVLNKNRQFMLSDQTNYLMSLKRSSLYDGDIVLSCHRQAHIGQQKSVIMLANRKTRDDEESQLLLDGIKEENAYEETEDDQCSKYHLKMYIQDRSFVEYSSSIEINVDNEVDKMLLKTLNSIDIKEIENLYTIEEKSYIQFMGHKFRDKWCEVNIGPEVMRDYIAWCKNQRPLSQEMFQVVSRATRERFTRMVETTDEFQDLNIHDKFCLLKSNLKYADTVTMIRKLSFLNPKDDYFDSWGSEDRVMWDESGMNLHSESMSNILREMPFDVKLKHQFISLLSQCQLPILADQHVFSLMVAIVIFSSGDIQLIERGKVDSIRDGYFTMLKRYVWQDQEDAENIINRALMVISVIPKLSELFRKMNIIENI